MQVKDNDQQEEGADEGDNNANEQFDVPLNNQRSSTSDLNPKVKQKRKLLAYQNKPSACAQLSDLITMHWQHLCGKSCFVVISIILVPIICICCFASVKSITEVKEYPDYHLQRLKHPVYSTSYYMPEYDEFGADFDTSLNQQLRFEDFFEFADYSNTKRVIGKDDEGNSIKRPSYSPGLDVFGPGSWLPMQCYSTVDYKYASTLIGIIKNGNQLEEDLLQQIQSIFADQQSIDTFTDALEEFLSKVSLGGGGSSDEKEEEEDEQKEEEPAANPPDPNAFTVPKELENEAGGGPESPHEVDTSQMGRFTYKEFKSIEELFDYARQEGYGWDPEIPAICFAFQVKENEDKNSYELEWIFRDQWPTMYQTGLRLDSQIEPINSAEILLGYTRVAYNGINLMQVFAANSIMQRRLSPEAEIVMFTVPYKVDLEKTSPLNVIVNAYLSAFIMFLITPLGFYFAYRIGKQKESGMTRLLRQNGLNPIMNFLSWFLQYTVLNFAVSLIFVIGLSQLIFIEDSFGLIFLITYMAIESIFGLIWAVQPFTQTGRMALLTFGFIFWVGYYISFLVNQPEPVIETDKQKVVALFPLAAVKMTLDNLAKFHYMFWAMNFDNWHLIKNGWSLQIGVQMFFINLLIWTAIGIVFDILLHTPCRCFSSYFNVKVTIENNLENKIQIEGLKERIKQRKGQNQKGAPEYDFTVHKGKVCCLIGNNSAQKTNLLEMIAGVRPCDKGGSITVKDSDFFVRGNRPNIKDFLVYRSSEVILDDELTAIQHLNLFAHIRGNQKYRNTSLLCDKLLPEKLKVGQFSESQRQCLQTLIALVSENSKILLLDEPTRGLGPEQRSELIRTLWRFKRDRYVIISSSDAELVNMLADSVAKVLQSGVQMVSQQEVDHKLASYKLSVEVVGGKPSNNLVKYLTHEVQAGLTLEYHSELMTYYILPNIPKSLLHRKSLFMENNKELLGLINFEFVSLTEFEVAQRNIVDPQNANKPGGVDSFEESVEDNDYEGDDVRSEFQPALDGAASGADPQMIDSANRGLLLSSVEMSEMHNDGRAVSAKMQHRNQSALMMRPDDDNNDDDKSANIAGTVNNAGDQDMASSQNCPTTKAKAMPVKIQPEVDPEMRQFQMLKKTVLKRPNYKRELFYDFKKFRARRKFCCIQCCGMYARHCKENFNQKLRFLGLLIIPSLSIFMSYYCFRSYFSSETESKIIDPNWYQQNKILVNEKTIIGEKDTKKWIEKLPRYPEGAFEADYANTEGQESFLDFYDQIFDHFTSDENQERPWSYGSYEFYDMNEEKNQYQFMTHVNLTSPFSTLLYPQFIIESILKNALDDDNFEFKVKQTPLPAPYENVQKGSFLTSADLAYTNIFVTMSDVVAFWGQSAAQVSGCLCFAWVTINLVIMLSLMRDRMSGRKHYMESHGQSKLAYWLARFFHDILFFIPVSLVVIYLINIFDSNMEQAPRSIMVAPFAMLPFLYVIQHLFEREVTAVMSLMIYQLNIQFILPFLTIALRLSANSEKMGDQFYQMAKALPMESVMSSILYNKEVLKALARYRENNENGVGLPIETDETHDMNAPADVQWMIIHIIVFWVILIFIIEYRLHCICCDPRRMKEITRHDNDIFFGTADKDREQDVDDDMPKDSESSEIPQIIGEGENIKLRFNVRQKPRKELALTMKNLRVEQRRGFCQWLCCKKAPPNQILINDLALQIQAGSKFAILADSSKGKTHILETLTSRRSALKVSAILSKQIGRGAPVYTCQRNDLIFFEECTLKQNFDYYLTLGSVHPRIIKQMMMSFGLVNRQDIFIKNLNETERHITQLILALSGSNRTVILDEPFSGLTSEQNLKLIKIIRQKHDCTIIVTAKSKAQIELFQPHQIVQLQRRTQDKYHQSNTGFLLALRLRYNNQDASDDKFAGADNEQSDLLTQIVSSNFSIFEKLRFKKRSIVLNVVNKLMRKAKMNKFVSDDIAQMVHEDLELEMTSEEMVIKCQLIRQLYNVVEALCKRFGECHIELKQDEYTVLRVGTTDKKRALESEELTEEHPHQQMQPSLADNAKRRSSSRQSQHQKNHQKTVQQQVLQPQQAITPSGATPAQSSSPRQAQSLTFSELVDFVNTNACIKANAHSCHFLNAQHNLTQARTRTGMKPPVKIFRFSNKLRKLELVNPQASAEGTRGSGVATSSQVSIHSSSAHHHQHHQHHHNQAQH